MIVVGRTQLSLFTAAIERRSHGIRSPLLAKIVASRETTNLHAVRVCYQGYWKEDLVSVNGWNEYHERRLPKGDNPNSVILAATATLVIASRILRTYKSSTKRQLSSDGRAAHS